MQTELPKSVRPLVRPERNAAVQVLYACYAMLSRARTASHVKNKSATERHGG